MDKIIEMITDVPYGFVNQGHADYMFRTDKSQHWILVDENNNLVQMVGYKLPSSPGDEKLYDTGKINVTDHTLRILIASLILIPFRDEIYRPEVEGEKPELTDGSKKRVRYLAEVIQGKSLTTDELIENMEWLFKK